jgi:hypothetical protein
MFFRTFFRFGRCSRWSLAACVGLGILAASSALHAGEGSRAELAAAAQRETLALAALAGKYRKAGVAQNGGLESELLSAAAGRRELLYLLIQADPGEALRLALPARLRNTMPAAAKDYIEAHRELNGTLEVRFEHTGNDSRLAYELDTGTRRIELHFANAAPRLFSGTPVRARGVLLDDAMAVESGDSGVTLLDMSSDDPATGTATAALTAPLTDTFGAQRVLVLLVNWQDFPAEQPFSVEAAQELVFGTVSDFMLENSFQRTWLNGAVHGWYTLPLDRPVDSTTCKHTVVAAAAQDAARNAGVDLAAFDRYVYVFPQTACFPSGTATVGGDPSEVWINGKYFQLKTVAHELGHNLGLFHAGALDCDLTALGDDCRTSPYGDIMDVMGNRSTGHFNAHMKERLGWLDPDSATIVTATGGGVYALEAYEHAPQGLPKALKLFKDVDSSTGDANWYYLEYRQALGFDDFLAGNANVLDGVVLRVAAESATPSPIGSLLLDMTPGSQSYDDLQDPALPFGESFTDPGSGLTLSSRKGEGQSAIVEIGFGTASCLPSTPQLSIAPTTGQWVSAGSPASYAVLLKNTDSTACTAAGFDLEAQLPSGWTATVDAPELALEPGGSGDAALTITSSQDALDGVYSIDIVAARDGGASEEASATVSLVISASAPNNAPIAMDDAAVTAQGSPVMITVLANDHDPDGDPLVITAVTQPSGGTVRIHNSSQLEYMPLRKFKGQDRFQYTTSDGLAAASANVDVLVEGKSGGAGGGPGGGKGKDKNP